MRFVIATITGIALAATTAVAQQKAPADATTFAKKVASSNTFEIESSELAKKRAQSGEVKSFADKMIADHTKAGKEFKVAVQAAKVSPPPEQPDGKQKAVLAKLRGAQGSAFDKAYLNAQLNAHKQAVSLFRTYSKNGRSEPLRGFAQKTLPTLEHHLSMVQELSRPGGVARKQGTGGAAIGPPADRKSGDKKR